MGFVMGFIMMTMVALPIFAIAANPSAVIINEILPSPEGADAEEEWIEIFNRGDAPADLSGWKIEDMIGKTKTYVFPKGTTIEAKGFLILRRPTSKITLNNEGDGLRLSQPNGAVADNVNYSQAPQGKSYSLTGSGWVWGRALTPGAINDEPRLKQKRQPAPLTATAGETAKQSTGSWLIFLTAIFIAVFSGAIILTLKKKISYNKPSSENLTCFRK